MLPILPTSGASGKPGAIQDVVGNALGIVHRDVSPQNLFISYDGAVKLLDFGIAKNAMQDGRTRTGLLKGKISYMAPEQARGETLDRRADLWSLGVLLWEAVTGKRLFKGVNEAATLNLTLTEEVSAPSTRRPDLPPELENILMRALKRDPTERYATAADMRDELETWLSGRELSLGSSVSLLMQRLFSKEMREQRQQVQGLLHAQPDVANESGITLIAPMLGGTSTLSAFRSGTQVSSVTDLMNELTRQRRVTTRLLSGLLALVGLALLFGIYWTLVLRPMQTQVVAAAAIPVAAPTPVAVVTAAPVATESAATKTAVPTHAGPSTVPFALPRTPTTSAAIARGAKVDRRAVVTEAVEPAIAPSTPATATVAETGLLNLDTQPWSIVSVGGRVLGQTPIVGASLPVGTHTVVLSNPELGLKTTYQVTITAGRTTARRVGLD